MLFTKGRTQDFLRTTFRE